MRKVISRAAVVGFLAILIALSWFYSTEDVEPTTRAPAEEQDRGGKVRTTTTAVTRRVAQEGPKAEPNPQTKSLSAAQLTGPATSRLAIQERSARPDDRSGDAHHEQLELEGTADPPAGQPEEPVAEGGSETHPTVECTAAWCWSDAAGIEVMRAEVTAGEFGRCVAAGQCRVEGLEKLAGCTLWRSERSHLPMNCLDYNAAADYCRWQNARLPRLEEWYAEYRSRGKYPWGDEEVFTSRVAEGPSLGKLSGASKRLPDPPCTHPEGRSESGLCDMVGNLAEWTADPAPGAAPPTSLMIVVGFAYDSVLHDVQTGRGLADEYTGFRCARDRATLGKDAGP